MASDISPLGLPAKPLDMDALRGVGQPARSLDMKVFEIFARLPDYIQHVLSDKNNVEKVVPNPQLKNIVGLAKDPKVTGNLAKYFNRNTINKLSKFGPEQLYKISLNKVLNGEDPLKEFEAKFVAQAPISAGAGKAENAAVKAAGTEGVEEVAEVESANTPPVLFAQIEHALLEIPNKNYRYAQILTSGLDPEGQV